MWRMSQERTMRARERGRQRADGSGGIVVAGVLGAGVLVISAVCCKAVFAP